jgi:thioredoxin-dependent peroxiredoxin
LRAAGARPSIGHSAYPGSRVPRAAAGPAFVSHLSVRQAELRPATLVRQVRRAKHSVSPRVNPTRKEEIRMALRIGDEVPDFSAESTAGTIRFHDFIGDGWAILFSHPKDFTPVCTTELGYMAGLKPEFDKRNTKLIGLSVDSVGDHERWSKDIQETQGHAPNYPLIGDTDLKVAKLFDMIHPNASGSAKERTAADNATVRSVFVIGPDKKVKAMLTYPMSTGRNFDEVLRLLDSIQLTAKHKVATPVNWKQGEDVIILASVPEAEAKERFPEGWKAPKPYLRIVKQPK